MNKPNILIAVLAYGGSVKNGCAYSLLKLQKALSDEGFSFDIRFYDSASTVETRNYCATLLLREGFSHLAFVDHDMDFEPSAYLRLLKADKPLVGCICPLRRIDLNNALELVKTNDPVSAIALSSNFTICFQSPKAITVTDGFCLAYAIGMGVSLIRRDCIEALSTKVSRHNAHSFGNSEVFGFFDAFPSELSPYAEDFAFCRRWAVLCGGEIWALIDEPIGHIGEFTYRADYVAKLKSGRP